MIETMRASGPGGQQVNKTESAVRVTHIPTGLTVVAREERSQHMNRKLAVARLGELMKSQEKSAELQGKRDRWQQHNELERGNPIRTYEGTEFKRKA